MAWTSPYSPSLTSAEVAHFLRRATFGTAPSQIRTYQGRTAVALFDAFSTVPAPAAPTDADGKMFHNLPWGAPKTDPTERNSLDGQRRTLVKQWWLGLMLDPARGFAEKLTLFWQNHFVVESDTVQDVRYQYRYMETLRRNALGNFRTFVIEITQDPAMLRYLNGTENVVGRPNENYGRELMELFMLGRGYYTENDVKETARVLTGWRALNYRNANTEVVTSQFNLNQHDRENKTFSENFKKKVIEGGVGDSAGAQELGELVDMILAHPESARFIVRKLYRWYVAGEISAEVEKNFIEPLAVEFRKNFQLQPIIRQMLTSDHFFDPAIRGGQIRSPLDFLLGSFIALDTTAPSPITDRRNYDILTNNLLRRSRNMEMEVLEQPTVFGWRPYYDTGYYKIWISGTTLGLRGEYSDLLVRSSTGQGLQTDVVNWVRFVSNPGDPVVLVREVWTTLMAVEPTPEQVNSLVDDAFLDGIPRYEWTEIWNTYVANPKNNAALNNAKTRLVALLTYLFRLAEYQLS